MASPTDPKVAPDKNGLPHSDAAPKASATPPVRPAAPPPRPVRPPPIARPKAAAGPFADLPDLPKMGGNNSKRKLTLVGMLQGSKKTAGHKTGRLVLSGVGMVLLAGIGASVLYRQTLVKHLVPRRAIVKAIKALPIAPVLTPQQQAARALAAGSEAYSHRDYGKAVASFEEALNLDSTLADAHRSLGIVHADLHDEAEAMAHYQKYIEMVPHGRDSARVQKIIADYNAAHAPPPEPPAAPVLLKKQIKGHARKAHKR